MFNKYDKTKQIKVRALIKYFLNKTGNIFMKIFIVEHYHRVLIFLLYLMDRIGKILSLFYSVSLRNLTQVLKLFYCSFRCTFTKTTSHGL